MMLCFILESFENKNPARDTIVPTMPFAAVQMKRKDGTEKDVTIYYLPITDRTRVQYDDAGHRLLYDPEHYFATYNDNKDFVMIQFYTWGKVLRNYQDFFVKPGVK